MTPLYERCSLCGNLGYRGSHTCPPEWEWWGEKPDDAEPWGRLRASDAEGAAVAAAEAYDTDGDYYILRGGAAKIWVKQIGSSEMSSWHVTGESVPHYFVTDTEDEDT